MLAQVYEEGIGPPVDLAKAYMCFDMLGTAGFEEKRAYCAADDRRTESGRFAFFSRVAREKLRLYDAVVRVKAPTEW